MGLTFPRLRTSILVLAVTLGGTAHAGEFLHMPFACRFDGARVELRASGDRAYEVIGRREREIYTACSPADPDRCRSWFVHRFDLDCSGARVSWLEVAAAAARDGGRVAWVDDGRFSMRMGRFWSVARDDGPGFARRDWRGGFPASDQLDELGSARGGGARARWAVTLPPGFAPALGVPIAFSGDNAAGREARIEEPAAPSENADLTTTAPTPHAEQYEPAPITPDLDPEPRPLADAPAEVATSDAEPVPQPIPELPRKAPHREANSTMPPAAPVEAAAAPAASAAVPAEGRRAATKVTVIKPEPLPQAGEEARAVVDGPVAESVPGSIKPVIINAPHAAVATPATPPAPRPAERPAAASASPAGATAATGSMETAASNLPPAADPSASALVSTDGSSAIDMAALTTSAAALLLATLAGFGFWRWSRASAAPVPPADRDLANVSLDGAPNPKRGLLGIDRASEPEPGALRAASTLELSTSMDDLPVPTTYDQALAALGVNANASVDAIKKVVDGLRRSWHPDHAASESDRVHREHRLRQINVAWDLITEKRPAA